MQYMHTIHVNIHILMVRQAYTYTMHLKTKVGIEIAAFCRACYTQWCEHIAEVI